MSIDFLEKSRTLGKPITFYLIQGGSDDATDGKIGPYGFCDGEETITLPWITQVVAGKTVPVPFIPWPISSTDVSQDGTLDKSDITLSLALGSAMDDMFLAYPPSQVVNLSMFQGHYKDELIPTNYPAKWIGRVLTGAREENELSLNCQPVSSSVKRPGLRRNYQIGCPHVLYGQHCRASKSAATVNNIVLKTKRNVVELTTPLGRNYNLFIGGLVEWTNEQNKTKETRTIAAINSTGTEITIRGVLRGILPRTPIKVIRGCNHLMTGCNQHNNILNYGGQPYIPLENPLSTKNQFY